MFQYCVLNKIFQFYRRKKYYDKNNLKPKVINKNYTFKKSILQINDRNNLIKYFLYSAGLLPFKSKNLP